MGKSTTDIITSSQNRLDERGSMKAELSVAFIHLTEYKSFKSVISRKNNCRIESGAGPLSLKNVCIKPGENTLTGNANVNLVIMTILFFLIGNK